MIKARAYLIFFILILAFFMLAGRLYTIQVKQHDKYALMAIDQQNKTQSVKAERGRITDRNGELLAYSKNEISFFVNNAAKKKSVPDSVIAAEFSRVFGKSFSHYMNLLNSGRKQVCLEKKVSRKFNSAFSKLNCGRLYYLEDNRRIYPYGSLASHVLGYINNKFKGVDGVEGRYEKYLCGTDGKLIVEKDAAGKVVGIKSELSRPALNGKSVVLTIDKNYQKILEEELLDGFNKSGGEAAVGIIVDPKNGEILALGNLPNYDPGNYNLFDNRSRRNRAISDSFEPGSTIKSVFLSMLLEEKSVDLDEVINTENGKYKLSGAWIKDTHSFNKLTVREVLEHSSNIGIVKLSERISDNLFYKYLRDFGFGNETHIELPGEIRGKLKKPAKFSKLSKPFIAHGYEIAVTPLQLTLAYSALVNGGILFKPQIIKKIVDRRGNTVELIKPKKIRRVISEETSDRIIDVMEGVVENGTGKLARLNNIRVGGKTGTSHRFVNGSYSHKDYNASFVGFFPVENPQLVCFIWVQSPRNGKFGGQVAAPIFKKIAERIVNSDVRFVKYKQSIERSPLRKESFTIDLNNEKTQFERHSNPAPANDKAVKKTSSSTRFTMPNLINKPLRKVMAITSATGLKIEIEGSGKVIWQSIPAGKKIFEGDKLKIKCSSNK